VAIWFDTSKNHLKLADPKPLLTHIPYAYYSVGLDDFKRREIPDRCIFKY
jgi:hypothetical protein